MLAVGILAATPAPASAAPVPITVKSAQSEPGRPATAHFPAGTMVVNGGYFVEAAVKEYRVVDFVLLNAPATPTAWIAQTLKGEIIACAPTRTTITHSTGWSALGAPTDTICPGGSYLLSGGYAVQARLNDAGENVDALVADGPADQPANSWGARLKFFRAVAYAVCAPLGSPSAGRARWPWSSSHVRSTHARAT